MCDYSLHAVQTRLAREGEHLIVHRFSTGSRGLTTEADIRMADAAPPTARGWWHAISQWLQDNYQQDPCAVCIPPGARLVLLDVPPNTQRDLGISANEPVTFTQISSDWGPHRDAIRLSTGRELLLQSLPVGQHIRIVTLTLAEDLEEPGVAPETTFARSAR